MIRLGVISDSHGNIENIKRVIEYFKKQKRQIKYLIHLGDNFEDMESFLDVGYKIIRVPGVYNKRYKKKEIPNKLIKKIEGVNLFITHVPRKHEYDIEEDLDIDDLISENKINIVLYGHTHKFSCNIKNDVIYFNPGHLKANDDAGYPASFAQIDINKNKVTFVIKDFYEKYLLVSRYVI